VILAESNGEPGQVGSVYSCCATVVGWAFTIFIWEVLLMYYYYCTRWFSIRVRVVV